VWKGDLASFKETLGARKITPKFSSGKKKEGNTTTRITHPQELRDY